MKNKKPIEEHRTPRCPNHRNRRVAKLGVCIGCYNTLYARVRRGDTTWDQLKADGVIGPPGKRGRPRKEFKAAF